MSKSTSVIEVNGNQYDAVTGQLVGVVQKITKQVKNPAVGKSIDGFARRPSMINAAQAMHKRAQHSQTLMRAAVKRPPKSNQSAITKSQGNVRDTGVDPLRFSHAHSTAKSHKVSRFGHISSRAKSQGAAASPVITGEVMKKPGLAAAQTKNATVAKPLPSMVASASHQQLERLLDIALVRADAHKQQLRGKDRPGVWQRVKRFPKWLSFGTGLFIVILAVGILAWQKIPQVSIKIAALRAHVNATVPAYLPSGFSLAGPVQYGERSVTVSFKNSKDDTQAFELTQKASSMDSSSFVATALPHNTQVQTSQVNGTTVYVYGPTNNAVWVNHGVAYTIKDSANLDSDQLLRIASSL